VPTTHFGRFAAAISAILGVIFASLLTASLSRQLSWTPVVTQMLPNLVPNLHCFDWSFAPLIDADTAPPSHVKKPAVNRCMHPFFGAGGSVRREIAVDPLMGVIDLQYE
jgi:hypothetical protein